MEHRKYRKFIASGSIVSIVSFILVCISFTSDDWIDAKGSVVNKSIVDHYLDSIIHYGLFRGILTRKILSSSMIYHIYFTCVWEENLCAWSCLKDEDSRLHEVKALIRGRKPTFSCSPISVLVWPELRFGIQDRNNTNGQDD
ncbi:hypothetical protein PV325_007745 [Microctonus aethiopoides]|uniref:Uncharacterized protein n=1 Tax=Microctonus aethiopoides TaxID=144406 RepID=A0AA39EU31_9HYME|nr:hypothetical protein PV325_007745 [Microctonus aethiopoides]KAK0081867.1 hypothetical protein PV326_007463 [Microctonus aethiopoides]KAK0156899.1 hypothetical protein PV328_012148 [Microctonus aethiopoides]